MVSRIEGERTLGLDRVLLWRETLWLFPIYSGDFVLLLIPALPLLYILQRRKPLESIRENRTTPIVGFEIVSIILLGALWAPAKAVALSHPQDLSTVKIEMARGPCFGDCPVYTATVHGDGQVEYIGRQGRSRSQTRKLGRIGREKVIQILQTLDQVKFMTLDDRAFSWGFDTPSVGVGIWEDGRTKRVVSDAEFVGSKDGRQSRFVKATQEIDSILQSAQWSHCEGEGCANPISAESPPD